MRLSVKKRSGNAEQFSLEKLFQSIIRAGGSGDLAENAGLSIAHKLNDDFKAGTVDSSEIRARVLAVLKKADAKTAQAYSAYAK